MVSLMKNLRAALIVPGVLLIGAVLGQFYGPRVARAAQQDNSRELRGDLRTFARLYSLVEANYASPVDADRAIYDGAIPGMLRGLDPHSSFFDPRTYARMRLDQQGHYFGVGMRIGNVGDHIVVGQVFEGSPAFKAGLRPRDIISGVDHKPTTGMSTDEVATMLKGPRGTPVSISVTRKGRAAPIEVAVIRDEVHSPSVDAAFLLSPGVPYIHLSGFNETSAREIADIIDHDGGEGELKGMVLDLRGNPGGLLTQAVDVSDMFLAKGQVIVSHHGRSSPERVYTATHGNDGHDFPLVLLVDSGTASAAEIVSGAVQDHDRGLVVGQTTFGKGLVQTVYPLSEGTGLALTTAHYYTPSGRLIQRNYEGVSLYDYYYARPKPDAQDVAHRETKMTDSGRTVYGGGGITPDVILPEQKLNDFQASLADHGAIQDFTDAYLNKHDVTSKDWTPTPATLTDFQSLLLSEQIPFSAAEINANADWIKLQIRRTVVSTLFGQSAGLKILAQNDPEVSKALTLLPQAEALDHRAKELLAARRNAGRP